MRLKYPTAPRQRIAMVKNTTRLRVVCWVVGAFGAVIMPNYTAQSTGVWLTLAVFLWFVQGIRKTDGDRAEFGVAAFGNGELGHTAIAIEIVAAPGVGRGRPGLSVWIGRWPRSTAFVLRKGLSLVVPRTVGMGRCSTGLPG